MILETTRLTLRRLSPDDAGFIFELVNEPAFLRYIGDKGVRTLDDARSYILNGPVASYHRHGFGLYLVQHKADAVPVGMCGLVKRDGLKDPDVGYAFLEHYWGKGYASESVEAVLAYGRDVLGLKRIVAITAPDNHASIRVLEKMGLQFEQWILLPGGDAETLLFTPASEAEAP